MTVYVDSEKAVYYNMRMSHMIADTPEELHAMAEKIGVKRKWFQDHRVPHYDICQNKRVKAIENGAVVVATRKEFVTLMFKMGFKTVMEETDGKLVDTAGPSDAEIEAELKDATIVTQEPYRSF